MNRMSIQALCLHPEDNVATLLDSGADGAIVLIYSRSGERIASVECGRIPRGHKIALDDLREGQAVRKYGQVIGVCTSDISRGDWVHVHNMASGRVRGDHESSTETVIDK